MPEKTKKLTLELKTRFIASVIRNHMEDFHVKNLSDIQMKELNPLIRDAIYTSLNYMDKLEKESEILPEALEEYCKHFGVYWEEPKVFKIFN